MNIVVDMLVMVVQGLLGLLFIMVGFMKIIGVERMRTNFANYGYASWFRVLIGVLEVLSGICLLIGFWVSALVSLAAALLVVIMAGAIFTHLRARHKFIPEGLPATILLLLSAVILLVRWPL